MVKLVKLAAAKVKHFSVFFIDVVNQIVIKKIILLLGVIHSFKKTTCIFISWSNLCSLDSAKAVKGLSIYFIVSIQEVQNLQKSMVRHSDVYWQISKELVIAKKVVLLSVRLDGPCGEGTSERREREGENSFNSGET